MPGAVAPRLSSTAEDLEDITATAQKRAKYMLVMIQIPCCLTIDLYIWAISGVLVSIHRVAAALWRKYFRYTAFSATSIAPSLFYI